MGRNGTQGVCSGINGKIFVEQGRAIAENARLRRPHSGGRQSCNTNCLIAMSNGKDIPQDRWFAMTRLDENRAKTSSLPSPPARGH